MGGCLTESWRVSDRKLTAGAGLRGAQCVWFFVHVGGCALQCLLRVDLFCC